MILLDIDNLIKNVIKSNTPRHRIKFEKLVADLNKRFYVNKKPEVHAYLLSSKKTSFVNFLETLDFKIHIRPKQTKKYTCDNCMHQKMLPQNGLWDSEILLTAANVDRSTPVIIGSNSYSFLPLYRLYNIIVVSASIDPRIKDLVDYFEIGEKYIYDDVVHTTK